MYLLIILCVCVLVVVVVGGGGGGGGGVRLCVHVVHEKINNHHAPALLFQERRSQVICLQSQVI